MRWRQRYMSRSKLMMVLRLALGGITAAAPRSSSSALSQSASNALSPSRAPKATPSISGRTPTISWCWPGSRTKRTKVPRASTRATILVVRPPRERPMAWVRVPPCMGLTMSSVISSVRTQSAGRNRDRPRCSLGGAWPLHLVSGRPSKESWPTSHVRGPRRGRESGTHLCNGTVALGDTGPRSSRFVASSQRPPQRTYSDLQHGALWHNPDRHVAPQRDNQLAGHRNQHNPAHPALAGAHPLVEPAREGAARLVAQPQPGQLDRGAPRSRVARLGNALVAPDCAALPWTRSEAEVATHLTPVAEVAEEHFIAQHRGKREPDAAQLRQSGGGAVLLFRNGLLLGFPPGDHLHHQPQPSTLAQQLSLQTGGQRQVVRRAQGLEPRLPISPGRLEIANALGYQQTLDAAGVLASLDDKPGSLARAPSRILLRWCGHVHDAADLRLAALQRHQRAQEPGGIKAVRLGPPRPPIDQQTGGIQHPVLDAAGAQPAVQPEAVVASLEAAHDPNRPAELLLRLAALARDQREQAVGVAAVQPVLADLVRQGRVEGHAPRGAAQLEGHEQRGRCRLSQGRGR